MMNYDEYHFSREYLTSGERIIWKGKPGKGNLLSSSDVFLIPFSIVWGGFAFFWEFMVISSGGPAFFALFGLPFVLLGVYLIFGRFIHLAYLRKRTFYVITNEKIIRKRGKKIDYLSIRNLPTVQVKVHKNGYGTISFQQQTLFGNLQNTNLFNPGQAGFTIENVSNVVQVQKTILEAQQNLY